MKSKHLLLCIAVVVCLAGPLRAQDEEDLWPLTKLVLQPAPAPRQALKYRLLPNAIDRKSGNAAVIYNRSCLSLAQLTTWREHEEWIDLPIEELPLDEAEKVLRRDRLILDQVALAATRDHCDWEILVDEQDPIAMLSPEITAMRGLTRLVVFQFRVQIAAGRLDEAIRTLQIGYAMGRHTAEAPTLVHGLVGIAICQIMSNEVELLIQQPEAPNMYWALTALPRPLVDMRQGIESEMNLLYQIFPELREVDDNRHGKAYWQNFSYRLAERLTGLAYIGRFDETWKSQLAMTALAIRGYPIARQSLIDRGRPVAEVEAMPVPQVVAIYTLDTYNELRDEQFKWLMVPYHETHGRMDKADQRLREGMQREIFPLASLFLPGNTVKSAVARNQRTIAMLRTIEAIRMFVADHNGRLPESLDDIQAVPIPLDPMTGKPFLYEKNGQTVVLKTPPPQEGWENSYARHFEIRFQKIP